MKKINNKGFTLIELIVVITIIGILVGMSVPNIMKIKERASEEIDIANREGINNAVKLAILDGVIESSGTTWDKDDNQSWSEYLDKWPEYPLDKNESYSVEIKKENNDWITTIKPEITKKDQGKGN